MYVAEYQANYTQISESSTHFLHKTSEDKSHSMHLILTVSRYGQIFNYAGDTLCYSLASLNSNTHY
jgi:hypothetical protein